MSLSRKTGKILIAAAMTSAAVGFLSWIGPPVSPVSEAEARIGRPLTPVSVAGVGRRTVRRCAAGVYNC